MPSPGGEGAKRSEADEVEMLRYRRKRQKNGHLISRLRRQLPASEETRCISFPRFA